MPNTMNLNLAAMNGQQAPCAVLQACGPPTITARNTSHPSAAETVCHINHRQASVTRAFSGLPKSDSSQRCTALRRPASGGRPGSIGRRTSAASLTLIFLYGDASVVPVHEQRDRDG